MAGETSVTFTPFVTHKNTRILGYLNINDAEYFASIPNTIAAGDYALALRVSSIFHRLTRQAHNKAWEVRTVHGTYSILPPMTEAYGMNAICIGDRIQLTSDNSIGLFGNETVIDNFMKGLSLGADHRFVVKPYMATPNNAVA